MVPPLGHVLMRDDGGDGSCKYSPQNLLTSRPPWILRSNVVAHCRQEPLLRPPVSRFEVITSRLRVWRLRESELYLLIQRSCGLIHYT